MNPVPVDGRVARASPMTDAMRGLVLALVVGAALVFDPRRGHVGSRPKYLLLVFGAVVGLVLLLGETLVGRRPWRGNWLAWPVVALVSWTAVAAAASEHPATAVFGFPGLHHGLLTAVALAVVFLATVAGFHPHHVRGALEALWFGAGGAVVVFGLAQLADRLVSHNQGWNWARPAIAPWTIGSTLGNPNHLSSFLAILLPLGLVLGITAGGRRRGAAVAVGVLVIAELAITTSRGGTLAAVAGLAVLGLLFGRRLTPHRRVALGLASGAAALALTVTVALGAAGVTKLTPGSFARTGPGTTLDLRLEVWATAWRVAADHPLLGVGPDVFPIVFARYDTERFMELYGPFTIANGAHNIAFDTLAELGAGGLVAFLMVLAVAAAGMRRRWRLLPVDGDDVGQARLLLGGTVAALVAYLVQASFNTEAVALSACFWVLLGLAVVLSSGESCSDPGPTR